jgi:hypothetical protein
MSRHIEQCDARLSKIAHFRSKRFGSTPNASAACSFKSGKDAKTSRPVVVQRRHPASKRPATADGGGVHSPVNYPPVLFSPVRSNEPEKPNISPS